MARGGPAAVLGVYVKHEPLTTYLATNIPIMEHFDTLQKELSKTLEQIGHVFAAPNDKTLTAAAAKLKYTLPRAQGNFQDALDRLSDQIVSFMSFKLCLLLFG